MKKTSTEQHFFTHTSTSGREVSLAEKFGQAYIPDPNFTPIQPRIIK